MHRIPPFSDLARGNAGYSTLRRPVAALLRALGQGGSSINCPHAPGEAACACASSLLRRSTIAPWCCTQVRARSAGYRAGVRHVGPPRTVARGSLGTQFDLAAQGAPAKDSRHTWNGDPVRDPKKPYQTVDRQTRRTALAGGALSGAVGGAAVGAVLGGALGWLGVALSIAGQNARAFQERRRSSDG